MQQPLETQPRPSGGQQPPPLSGLGLLPSSSAGPALPAAQGTEGGLIWPEAALAAMALPPTGLPPLALSPPAAPAPLSRTLSVPVPDSPAREGHTADGLARLSLQRREAAPAAATATHGSAKRRWGAGQQQQQEKRQQAQEAHVAAEQPQLKLHLPIKKAGQPAPPAAAANEAGTARLAGDRCATLNCQCSRGGCLEAGELSSNLKPLNPSSP